MQQKIYEADIPNCNVTGEILFGKVATLLEPEIEKMPERGFYGNENSLFDSGP